MKLNLPKTPCWNCPEGNHAATCTDARVITKSKNGKPTEFLRLIFDVHVEDEDNVQYVAKREYEMPIKPGTPLMTDLTGWLGADFFKKNRSFDTDMLKGKRADISVTHFYNEGYELPWVHIQSIHAPGSLVAADNEQQPQSLNRVKMIRVEDLR